MTSPRSILLAALAAAAVLSLSTLSTSVATAQVPDWENPAVVEINRQPVHSTYEPFSRVDDAVAMGDSPQTRSLNGRWKFHWAPRPDERPQDFFEADFR